MSSPSLFEEADELREVNGRMCRRVEDPSDALFGERWEPVDGAPNHEPTHKTQLTGKAKFTKAQEATFRAKTREILEGRGYLVYPVDRYNAKADRTFDLFGLFDFEAFRPHPTIPGTDLTTMVQVTSKAHLGDHVTKMCSSGPVGVNDKTPRVEYLRKFLRSGRLVLLLGFYKGVNGRWEFEERWLTIAEVDARVTRKRRTT